jgi:capsid protein
MTRAPCPEIRAYEGLDVPSQFMWIAQFFKNVDITGKDVNGKRVVITQELRPLPMVFYGETEEAVHAKAEAWWNEQQDKAEAKVQRMTRARQAIAGAAVAQVTEGAGEA